MPRCCNQARMRPCPCICVALKALAVHWVTAGFLTRSQPYRAATRSPASAGRGQGSKRVKCTVTVIPPSPASQSEGHCRQHRAGRADNRGRGQLGRVGRAESEVPSLRYAGYRHLPADSAEPHRLPSATENWPAAVHSDGRHCRDGELGRNMYRVPGFREGHRLVTLCRRHSIR